jgi:uncharacterized protein YkwD
VTDAIRDTPSYAQEYAKQAHNQAAHDVSALRRRTYDTQLLARQAVDYTNHHRAEMKLSPLRWNDLIAKVAAEHAEDMASGAAPFSHDGFDARTRRFPSHRTAGENLAMNKGMADVARAAVDGWIKSPGHRKNLEGLSPNRCPCMHTLIVTCSYRYT